MSAQKLVTLPEPKCFRAPSRWRPPSRSREVGSNLIVRIRVDNQQNRRGSSDTSIPMSLTARRLIAPCPVDAKGRSSVRSPAAHSHHFFGSRPRSTLPRSDRETCPPHSRYLQRWPGLHFRQSRLRRLHAKGYERRVRVVVRGLRVIASKCASAERAGSKELEGYKASIDE
jgi:hypothetical protein